MVVCPSSRTSVAGSVPSIQPAWLHLCITPFSSPQTLCAIQGQEVRAGERPAGQPRLQKLTLDSTLLLKRFWMLTALCVLLGLGGEPVGQEAFVLGNWTLLSPWRLALPVVWGRVLAHSGPVLSQVSVHTSLQVVSVRAQLCWASLYLLDPCSPLLRKPYLLRSQVSAVACTCCLELATPCVPVPSAKDDGRFLDREGWGRWGCGGEGVHGNR